MSTRVTGSGKGDGPLHKWTFADLVVIGIVLCIGLYSLFMQETSDSEVTEVLIFRDGVQLASLSPDVDRQIDLSEYGVNMMLEIRDRRVRVLSSDCRQQICVRRSWLVQPRESVFCLPNNITVELAGDNPLYDAISR